MLDFCIEITNSSKPSICFIHLNFLTFLNQYTQQSKYSQSILFLDSHSFLISCIHQFDSADEGTPVKNSGFCGQWSLKNAEILFKSSYTTESGSAYGTVTLDKHPMVKYKLYFLLFDSYSCMDLDQNVCKCPNGCS